MRNMKRMWRDLRGASALEFAIIAPLFLLILMTFVGFGIYLSVANSIQQVASDAARTAVAGVNATEREQLAKDYISSSTLSYNLIQPSKLTVSVVGDPKNANQFTVSVSYDATALPIWNLYSFAMPNSVIKRFSTIRIGGI